MNEIIAEIVQLSKLDHPNIVRFIDFDNERTGFWMTTEIFIIYMEFMEG